MVQIIEKDNTYRFVVKGTDMEVSFNKDGSVELYELADPLHTGFIFDDIKRLNILVNALSDILIKKQEGEK